MKNFLILLVGILAFSFMGASPNLTHNTDYAIEQLSDFEQSPVLIVTGRVEELNLSTNSVGDISCITISNIIGQVVLFKNTNIDKSTLDLSSLSNGLYLIKIDYTDKTVVLSKFIKETKTYNSDCVSTNKEFIDKNIRHLKFYTELSYNLSNVYLNKFSFYKNYSFSTNKAFIHKDFNRLKFCTNTEFTINNTLFKNKSKLLKLSSLSVINDPKPTLLNSWFNSKTDKSETEDITTNSEMFTSNIGYTHNVLLKVHLYI